MALTATYSANGKNIQYDQLKNLQITKKDYIDFIESIKKSVNDFHKEQK